MDNIKLNFFIKTETMTAKEYILFSKKIILQLQSFDSIFNSPNVFDIEKEKSYLFNNELSDFTSKNLKKIINEEKDIAYKNSDIKNKELSENSMSWSGFSSILFFNSNLNIENNPNVTLFITQGSYEEMTSSIKIEYSQESQDKLIQDYIFKLFNELTKTVDVKFANAISSDIFRKLRQRGHYTIGWITYLKNLHIYDLLDQNIKKEKINKGTCFSLIENKPKGNDENIIETANNIKQILSVNDFLKIQQ
ncbi:hypothetical protein [Cellulophaga sp. L1A9]|uniref:hypothetical protein n=1 Tax=Cellulophaga sp. L1A9 TaxID=2686362 RepID=UPI00131AEDC9|nr:hypothetical protein [Cellulophaga sp. L1A9]